MPLPAQPAGALRELPSERVAALDSARGAAMLFVCVSHFAFAYLLGVGAPSAERLMSVTMIASPAFMLISGITLGFLYEARGRHRNALRVKLLDRAAFILLIVHPLLALAEVTRRGSMATALQTGYITDTVALAMILGPFVIAMTRPTARLVVAAACVATTWLLLPLGEPNNVLLRGVVRTVIGSMTPEVTHFPLLPWFGVYLVGTVIGQRFHAVRSASPRRASLPMIGWGIGAAATAALVRIAANVSTSTVLDHPALMVWQKHPPSAIYFLWFGGCALVLIGACGFLTQVGVVGYLASWLRSLGHASLFVYLLQDVIYFTGLYTAHLPYTPRWPALLAATILTIAIAARIWSAVNGNRVFTLRIPALMSRVRRASPRRLDLADSPLPRPAAPTIFYVNSFTWSPRGEDRRVHQARSGHGIALPDQRRRQGRR